MTTTPTRRAIREPRRRPGVGSVLLGFFGELLITAGVLLALFVAWQLWWTDVEAAGVQRTLAAEYELTLPDSPDTVGSAEFGPPPPTDQALEAETIGRLWVPRWGEPGSPYSRTISEGTDRATVLDKLGIGHYSATAQAGEVGNFAIAAHRQSHGRPFYDIDKLQDGDELIVETADAWYVYTVVDSKIVAPTEVDVIAPNPFSPADVATERVITLTTCHPLFSTKERWIVHGVLDHWIPRESGRPAELVQAQEG